MAQEILNDLLNFKIKPEKIVEWLTTDNFNDKEWLNFNKNSSREEFITFFLNYLKDQFTRILQNNNVFKQTPVKKVLIQSQIVNSKKLMESDLESIKCDENIFSNNNELKNSIDGGISSEQNFKYLSITSAKSMLPCTPENTIIKIDLNSSSKVPTGPQISAPITKNKNCSYKQRDELINCNFNQNSESFKIFECKQFNNSTDNEIGSFSDNVFQHFEQNISDISNIFSSSTNIKKDESLELFNSNASQESSFSLPSKILQSSRESHSSCTLSPANIETSENIYSQINDSFIYLNNTSTPEKNINNMYKNNKSSQRQNICLGDFIGTEIKSTKKSSGKKHGTKILSKSGEQKHSDKNSVFSISPLKHSESNVRRRKVNPTRLNDINDKGNKENTVFGAVTRPFTQNPQFVNVSPIDKSVDNESFQFERGLVKKEREKKPEVLKTENRDTDANVIDKKNLLCTVLPIISCKIRKLNSIIIPDKILVDNKKVLDVLAILYSLFLDYNLVMNPMTELYFIILLITIQYKNNLVKTSPKLDEISNKIQNDNVDLTKDSSNKRCNLLSLRKSLTFDHMEEKNKISECSNENYQQHHDSDKCEGYNSSNKIKTNFNLVNTNLTKTTINVSSDEQIMDIKQNNVHNVNTINDGFKNYLDTPHNCVYFSTQILCYQKALLKCLDRVTLKLLCENNQIATFQPELCKYLNQIYNIKVTESKNTKYFLNIGTVDLNVSFQIDTDNREKFPSAIAFQCFRKQRDMFYEILKIWEDNHLVSGWKFHIALSGKIKTMLTMHADITNFTHLTRLFKSQMLISCIQNEQQDDLLDDETLSIFKNIKDNNLYKLTKLQKKLVTPVSQNGPVPLPSFPGIQEFYKDFILYSCHPVFYTYLEDTFVHEIMELSNSQFCGSDIEETETEVDERTRQNFFVCLFSLRLLSKFLGFMTSLPYRSETSMLENVINSQILLRSKCLPRIDLQYCLQIAVIEGKLSLTVPWVVEYLGMMDHATVRLPYYKRVLEILYFIYRASNYCAAINQNLMSQKTVALIKFTIGWLFELPIFPKELYYSWQSNYNDKTLKIICEMQQPITKVESSFNDIDTSVILINHCLFLDKLDIIDERILYSCCPFLKELNILLTPGNSTLNSSTSCKHITPVTSQLQNSTKIVNTKYLEVQLEEAFFHGQPMSTRKTVEYISERVASCCIKYIYNNLLPTEKKNNFKLLKQFYEKNYNNTFETNPKLIQSVLQNEINLLSSKASKNVKEKCKQILPKMCEFRVTQSIESLLSEDCLQSVKHMCIKIAIRMAMERIEQWIQLHVVENTIFMKDLDVEFNKILKSYNEVIIDKNLHNPNAASPTNVLDGMRNIICDLIETKGSSITIETLFKFCNQLFESLTERSDLKYISQTTISSLSVDLCLFLITYRNDLFTVEFQEKVFKVWKISHLKFSNPESPLSRILSPRNIVIMMQSDTNNVWIHFGKFLNKLLMENILSIDLLSDQAVALFRNEWTTTTTKNLSMCLNEAIKNFKSLDEETERIRYLLQWIAGTYNDMCPENLLFE